MTVVIVNVGQHGSSSIIHPFLNELGVDLARSRFIDLGDAVTPRAMNHTLGYFVARALPLLAPVVRREHPHVVVVQGDTSTALSAALAAFYARVPIAHVEAGLRTSSLAAPFPEEGHRRLLTRLANVHYAPTFHCAAVLRRESVEPASIVVTGNTVTDALRAMCSRPAPARVRHLLGALGRRLQVPVLASLSGAASAGAGADARESSVSSPSGRGFVVVTAHRRESHGAGLATVSAAVTELARSASLGGRWAFVVIAHTHPSVRRALLDSFGLDSVVDLEMEFANKDYVVDVSGSSGSGNRDSGATTDDHCNGGVAVIEPLDYPTLVALIRRADAVVTDSGGLQAHQASRLPLRDRMHKMRRNLLLSGVLVGMLVNLRALT